jgi:hypothetical protein
MTKFKYLKYVLLLFSMGLSMEVLSYHESFLNQTDGQVKVDIKFQTCSDRSLALSAGQTTSYESGGCCAWYITATGTSGSIQGKTAAARPPATGYGLACRDFSMVIKKTADNNIVIEQI